MKSGSPYKNNITLLSGGVGGAKLVRGFIKAFPDQAISIITNTADDAEFYGLHVSPDLDTMMYTLAGLSDDGKGWGIRDDTFQALHQMGRFGEDTWFSLGDKDLATHILRTKMLTGGKSLTQVTSHLSKKLGVTANILPMTDHRVETFIQTDSGTIPFQEYFVLRQRKVKIKKVIFKGVRKARPTSQVIKAIRCAHLIVFAPSNPIVSILPMLSVTGIRRLIMDSSASKMGVSPFLRKKAISGPAKELMESRRFEGSSCGAARFYSGLIDTLFIDREDMKEKEGIEQTGIIPIPAQTIMRDMNDSVRLAKEIFETFLQQR